MASQIDRPLERFMENQLVWLDTRNFQVMYNKKIRPKRNGPFKIKKVKGALTYQLELPKTWKIYDSFHPVHLSPYRETPQYGPNETRPAPDLIDNKKSMRWTTLFATNGTTKETYCSLCDGKVTQWKTIHGNPQAT